MPLKPFTVQTALKDGSNRSVEVELNVPETEEEFIAQYSKEILLQLAQDKLIVSGQAAVRGLLKNSVNTDEQIKAFARDWQYGLRVQTTLDPMTIVAQMTPEQRNAFIAKLQAMQG